MRWSVVIAMAVPPADYDLGTLPVITAPILIPVPVIAVPVMISIPISLSYLNPNTPAPDIGILGDDHRLVGDDRGTGKYRYGEEWNNTKAEKGFLHRTLSLFGMPAVPDAR